MPETQSIERTSASNSRAFSETTRKWVEERLSYLEGQKTSNNNHSRVKVRLAELGKLKAGWLDGKGIAPSQAALDTLAGVMDEFLSGVSESPRVFPTLEGGLQMEWFLQRRHHVTVEVHFDAKTGEIGIVDLETATDQTLKLDPDSSRDWRKVAQLIGQHS